MLRHTFTLVVFFASAAGCIIFATLGGPDLIGAEPPLLIPAPAPTAKNVPGTNAALVPIRPGLFQLGDVRLDKNRRAVSFPAVVNLREGNIEYLVVTTGGKTHESIFKTEAQPFHLHLAFLLLGVRGTTNALPEDPAKPLAGDPVVVEVSWKAGGELRTFRAEEFVHDRRAQGTMAAGNWVYTGSRIREDGFAAQVDGSIVSLITDADALLNNPRVGREDDDNWLVRTHPLPALNVPVEVTIRLPGPPNGSEKKAR